MEGEEKKEEVVEEGELYMSRLVINDVPYVNVLFSLDEFLIIVSGSSNLFLSSPISLSSLSSVCRRRLPRLGVKLHLSTI